MTQGHELGDGEGLPAASLPLAALLVGGESRRFGSDKAAQEIDGRSFLDLILDVVDAAGLPALLVGGSEHRAVRSGRRYVEDDPRVAGPPAGLAAALELAGRESRPGVVLLACDQPGLTPALLLMLVRRALEVPGAPLAFAGPTGLEPFPAYYPLAALDVARAATALRGVLASAHPETRLLSPTERTAFPDWVFDNINTPDDLVRHIARRR